jgi:two-component system NarL family sensor kinase
MSFLKRFLQQKELILLFFAGLFTIMVVDMLLVQGFHKDERYRERLMAERLQAQVQSTLEEHVTALIALRVVYQNFTDINPYDFQQYGKSITSTLHGFQRLYFIDPAMTIRQVYPLSAENTGLYGYSLKKQPQLSQALQHAKTSQSPTTSRLLPFLSHPKSFWAFIPIYRGNKEFLGFAAGEISLERLLQPYGQSFSQYQMQMFDPSGTKLFQQVDINPNNPNVSHFPFQIVGQEWTLELKPINPRSETLLLQRSSIWLGGLMILFLLSFIIMNSRRHKSELEEAQKQFETIFEASPDGIVLLDDKLNLCISNPVVLHWLGKHEEELEGAHFFDVFECQCPNVRKCRELSFLLCTSRQFAEDLPEVLETQVLDPVYGTPKNLRLNASRIIQDRDGHRETGFICVLGDISTSKELERIKETYVATLTHDLKTPLLAQQMVLETLSAGSIGAINEEQKRLLLGARESVQDLLDMVNSTLLFYKLESSHVNLHRHKMQLASLAKEVLGNLQPLADKRAIALELDSAMSLPDAWIDPVQMKRVFHNLVSNAISYGKRGRPIRVTIRSQQDESGDGQTEGLLVEVCNEGKGIQPEDFPKIFDKYYSLSRRFKQIGTGLGLYISRRIVELHGGKIWVESELNQQTRFFFSLPTIQTVDMQAKPEHSIPA